MSDLIDSCKEFVRRIAGCLIELGSVRSLSGDMRGVQ